LCRENERSHGDLEHLNALPVLLVSEHQPQWRQTGRTGRDKDVGWPSKKILGCGEQIFQCYFTSAFRQTKMVKK